MSDWHNLVCKIENVVKHPNADTLSIVTVLGDYEVVTKLDEYKIGDVVAYIAIDSIVPDTEEYHFLSPRLYESYEENGQVKHKQIGPKYPVGSVPEKNRIIKAKNIRNFYSAGLIVKAPPNMNIGDSVTEILQLKKWEEDEEEKIQKSKKGKIGHTESPPNWTIPYYDIEGLRKYVNRLDPNEEFALTEKLHGSNISFTHDGERLWVKSRNWFKKRDEECMWWEPVFLYDLETKLKDYPYYSFFGELIGKNKGFRYNSEVVNGKFITKVQFFDIYDVKNKRFLDYDEYRKICTSLELDVVPELYRGVWKNKDELYNLADGNSIINPSHIKEGFVLTPTKERFEPFLNGRMKLKLIGRDYNLQK